MITLTDTAKQKVLEFRQLEENEDLNLRLIARRRGARKFEYELNFESPDDDRPGDLKVDCGEFELRLDPESARNVDGATIDFEQRAFESGFRFDNPNARWNDPLAQAVQDVLDQEINPAVAAHGGHVELVAMENKTAYLAFGGGCQGCGMADVTLKEGVEVAIRNAVPEIEQILDQTDHAAGANPYFASASGESPF